MRFLMLVNATRDLQAGAMPKEELISALASAHEEPARAGTRLDASGLQPSSKSRCIGGMTRWSSRVPATRNH
jgi:hypothetical protein